MNQQQRSAVDAFVAHVRDCNRCFTADSDDLRCPTGHALWSEGDRAFAAAPCYPGQHHWADGDTQCQCGQRTVLPLGKTTDQDPVVETAPPVTYRYPGHRPGVAANDLVAFHSLIVCNALRGEIPMYCADGTILR